jgi:uncharacterized protein
MNETNIEVVQKMYQAFGENDIDGMLDVIAEDVVWEVRLVDGIPIHGRYHGHAGVKEFKRRMTEAVDVGGFVTTDFLVSGSKVVVLGNEKVTVKKTKNEVYNEWSQIFVIENGMIVAFQSFNDVAACKAGFEV